MKRMLSWLPAVFLMIIIFVFSSKPAEISGQSSLEITEFVYSTYESFTGQAKSDEDRIKTLENLDYFVRKGAHITEFAVLAVAIAWPLWLSSLKGYRLAAITIGLTAFYAASDEFHQTFIPGRSGEIRDVMIDTIGAVLGYIAFYIIIKFFNNRKQRNRIKTIKA
jgi:VanZ family protein